MPSWPIRKKLRSTGLRKDPIDFQVWVPTRSHLTKPLNPIPHHAVRHGAALVSDLEGHAEALLQRLTPVPAGTRRVVEADR